MSSTAVDLGHHQVFAARSNSTAPTDTTLVPLGARGDGLVVRWCERDRAVERFHDRLSRLVDSGDLRGASTTATAIAACLAELIPEVDRDRRLRLAVPLSASRGHRAHLRTAFGNAGFTVEEHDLIGRPYAALGYWLAVDGHRRGGLPQGKTLVLDNDGGRVSALVVDVARCLVLAEAQITDTSEPDAFAATLVIRRLLESAYGSVGHEAPVPWSVLSASIAEVVVSGSGADHPAFTRFISERFPASTLHPPPGPATEIVVRGMHHLERLATYRCAWPTLDLRFDRQTIRSAGSWNLTDASPTVAPVGTRLGFGGAPLVLRRSAKNGLGTTRARDDGARADDLVLADGCLRVPERVGPFPLLTLHPSGSIEIRGTEASLRLHLDWPVAGTPPRALEVVTENILDLTIDRSPFTPRGDPPHRATGWS